MCVIVYKPKGVEVPNEGIIRSCWNRNPDGAGMMWFDHKDKKVRIAKGFMTLKSFLKCYNGIAKTMKNNDLALHFRIKTHGTISGKNCHPFPISEFGEDMHVLSGTFESALMHNGVLSLTPRAGDFSDSAELAMNAGGFDSPRKYLNCVNSFLKGSKVLLFSYQNGIPTVNMYGDSFIKSGDLYYSNLHHQTYSNWYPVTSYSTGSSINKGGGGKPYTPCYYDEYDEYYGFSDEKYVKAILSDKDNVEDFKEAEELIGKTTAATVREWFKSQTMTEKLNIIDEYIESGLNLWSYIINQYPDSMGV